MCPGETIRARAVLVLGVCTAVFVLGPGPVSVAADFVEETFETEDGVSIDASFFGGEEALAVIFAHGGVFDKESWYPLAEALQKEGHASLSLNFRGRGKSGSGNRGDLHLDLLAAVEHLKGKGFKRIGFIGGSMGASAVLKALAQDTQPEIKKAILLAPAGGEPIKAESVEKLFIAAEGDRLFARAQAVFAGSSEPKTFKRFSGSAHAQHLFKSEHGQILTGTIVAFVKK